MVTLKLKRPSGDTAPGESASTLGAQAKRAPLRGQGVQKRPSLAERQAKREQQQTLREPSPAAAPPKSARHPVPQNNNVSSPVKRHSPKPVAPIPRNTAFGGASSTTRPPAARPDASPPPRPHHQAQISSEHAPDTLRLSKRLSELGLASRREADEWIAKGWVRVDGQVVSELGSRVHPSQKITLDSAARQQQAQQVTVLLNKPIGYVSGQAEDGYEPAFVLVTPQNQWSQDDSGIAFARGHLRSLVPAGRLDIDSVGLLVLTQDGRVAKTLIGEHSAIEKEYLVRVQSLSGLPLPGALSKDQLELLNHGLSLDGEALRPARVEWVNDDQLRFVLVEGKKRQIRRMCEAVGLKVTGLKRVRIGRVMLGDLPVGQWRYLRPDEVF